MTLLIKPLIDRLLTDGQLWNPVALERLVNVLTKATFQKSGQAIEPSDNNPSYGQIESAFGNFGLLGPFYPNVLISGSREDFVRIKSQPLIQLEPNLLAR